MSNRFQKNKQPKKGKKTKIIAVCPNLYLKTTPKGKKRWLLTAYNKKKKYTRVISDAAVELFFTPVLNHQYFAKEIWPEVIMPFSSLFSKRMSICRSLGLRFPSNAIPIKMRYAFMMKRCNFLKIIFLTLNNLCRFVPLYLFQVLAISFITFSCLPINLSIYSS